MAKFCTKCGKLLNEGEVCNCTTVVEPIQQAVVTTTYVAQQPQGNSLFKECVEIVKNFFKKPIDVLQENTNESKLTNSIVMIAINGLSIGLFVVVLIKEVLASLITTMGLLSGGMGGYASLITNNYQVKIPYLKYFIIFAIVGICAHFLLGAVTYLVSEKMFKGNTNIKKMITLYGFSSIMLSAGLLIATICLFINTGIAIAVLSISAVMYNYYTYKGLEFVCSTDKNKLGYVLGITYTIVLVVTYILSAIAG